MRHRRFQTRASPGIARVKFWSNLPLYCLARDDGADDLTARTTEHRRLGGGTGFFSTHKFTARAVRVACPGNPAAPKPPLTCVILLETCDSLIVHALYNHGLGGQCKL